MPIWPLSSRSRSRWHTGLRSKATLTTSGSSSPARAATRRWLRDALGGTRLLRDNECTRRRDRDELAQIWRQFLQEQYEVPASKIVKERYGRDEQGLGFGRPSHKHRRRPRHTGIEEAPLAAVQVQRDTGVGPSQIEQAFHCDVQLEDRALSRKRAQRRILPLAEVARELCQCNTFVRCEVEGWFPSLVPAIVAHTPSEAGVKNVERRIRWDVPNANAAPRAHQSGEFGQVGTPSYVAASSAKTRSISPRSMSCSAVNPPKTGNGVAMKRAKPSGE